MRRKLAAGGIATLPISRHQLYFHSDVPYTSHNSAMCTEMDVAREDLPAVIGLAAGHLADTRVEGADPGLCVACTEDIPRAAALIAFGRRAKSELLTKEEACQLAAAQRIHLSEHGGTGDGVIGALAGLALRLYGFDGRIKGKVEAGADGERMTASELLEKTGYADIMAINGAVVHGADIITLTEGSVKAVRMHWRSTILVAPSGGGTWATLTKDMLKVY